MFTSEGNIFPNFKRIAIEDKDVIQSYTQKYPPYSDFNILSLLCWNADENNSYSILNDNLVIKITDYLTENHALSVIGENRLDETLESLFSLGLVIKMVPEFGVEGLYASKFESTEDRDSFDYIINTLSLSDLNGRNMKNLRKNVRSFQNSYPNSNVKALYLAEKDAQDMIMSLTEKWCDSKGFNQKEKDDDIDAIEKFIKYSAQFKTSTMGLFVDDALVAFTLNELYEPLWVMGHFGKALNNYEKSSYYLEVVGAGWFNKAGYYYMNLQQDTGLLGLREAKMSYHPEYFLKKYTVKKN